MKKLSSKGLLSAMALVMVAAVGFAQPAHADWDHGHGHGRAVGWHRDGYHDWDHHRHWWHGAWVADAPGYGYYAPPPPVVYSPPPPSPGINLVVPLNFR